MLTSFLVLQPLILNSTFGQIGSGLYSSSISSITATGGLEAEMRRIEKSDTPADIATLAYIWGYPLISMKRLTDYSSGPNHPLGPGYGPINTFNHFRDLVNANFTNVVRPNQDTLYSPAFLDLKKPLVLQIPSISDRYYTLQFVDAYTNNFMFIGARTNVTSGGSYIITGPNWNETIPAPLVQIKSPTNLAMILTRILVNGTSDVPNVHAIQDKFKLSKLEGNLNSTTSSLSELGTNLSLNSLNTSHVSPQPEFIPKTGIKIFDEIGKDMIDNPPYDYDDIVMAKFRSIGIGPDLTPSLTANITIKQALRMGIINGERLIGQKVNNLGTKMNGWSVNLDTGNYKNDYLLRAAIANTAILANSPQEALYPATFEDSRGDRLSGNANNSYVIHFGKGKLPPIKKGGFWSVTLYNAKDYFVDNSLNRYSISDRTQGIKYNADGSLDIFIQRDTPASNNVSNWLPAPVDEFSLLMRVYIPDESILRGEYQFPPVQKVPVRLQNNDI